ncbi:ABC transporter permease [Paraconexibacter antarcticus]|uniref:ABC transporter permease n=1 Tax=Paraconexibacter antarcticus TaxID=2949664 RepID=A0ABY5DN20_9ACTN|nr:ATP-binding cassette domain-containing protein [Paraconexibacter antarcticus]UTI62830.1 ABC transporter permease [Paraconexibacter antarcticus]
MSTITGAVQEAEVAGISAHAVTVTAGGQTILREATLEVPVGKLVAVIGASGSGKSTLLRALAGVLLPAGGTVHVGGVPVRQRMTDVGYVPFGTLVHPELTVREALRYAAELRLPPGTSAADLDARADEVIAALHMGEQADVRMASLSDGQRRRASCGIELVGRPSVLLLDEPATGLDAVLEQRMMELLRGLADEGRGVLLSTHATSSLGLCDVVAVMAPGGELRFVGSPQEMLERFGVQNFDQVYVALALEEPRRPEGGGADRPAPAPPRGARAPRGVAPPLATQARVLARRYAQCTLRNRRQLTILVGQAPVIGLAIGFALPHDILSDQTLGQYYGVMLCFLLLVGAIWLGIIAACREVVRERAILARETAIGVRVDAYLCAKCAVLLPLSAVQVVLLVVPVFVLQPPGAGVSGDVQMLAVCVAASWAAVAMGLWLSAAVTSSDQATSSVPLVLIPQLLLAGAIIPLATMIAPLKLVANLTVSRWALTGLGSAMHLDTRLSGDIGTVTGFDPTFYSVPVPLTIGILAGGMLIMLSAAGFRLDRGLVR